MSPADHFEWALKLPAVVSGVRLPEVLENAVCRSASMSPVELHEHRERALAHWEERKRVTDPLWRQAFQRLPWHCQSVLGPEKNLFLLQEMLGSIRWPDAGLVNSLAFGFPIVGQLEPCGILPARVTASKAAAVEELHNSKEERNAYTLTRVRRSFIPDREVFEAFLEKCTQEVAERKAHWVRLSSARALLTARFPVDEGWREQAGRQCRKVRLIDDFSDNGVNGATVLPEEMRHDSLDTLVGLARAAVQDRPGVPFLFRKDDFQSAFKTLPVKGEHLQFAVATWAEAELDDTGLQLLSCPFGAAASVFAWHRFGSAVQALLAAIFLVAYPRFVDDFFGGDAAAAMPAEHAFASAPGAAALARKIIVDLLGWSLDNSKAVAEATQMTVLGVMAKACLEGIWFWIGDEKKEKWLEQIRRALRSNALSPAEAAKLAGRLSWGATAVFGKGARVFLAPLFWHGKRRRAKLAGRVRNALLWWEQYLLSGPCAFARFVQPVLQRCILYTDATGGGKLALVLQTPERRIWAAAEIPSEAWSWALPRRTQVTLWELVAALCGIHLFLKQACEHQELVVFIDNTAALHALLRGSSRQADLNSVIGTTWFDLARANVLMHAHYVPSSLNLADGPTRPSKEAQSRATLDSLLFREVGWHWPPTLPWGS